MDNKIESPKFNPKIINRSPSPQQQSPSPQQQSPSPQQEGDKPNLVESIVNFFSPPKEIISPVVVNSSFDRKTMHKVIDGVKYYSLEDLKRNKLKCLFETCELSWKNAEWNDR